MNARSLHLDCGQSIAGEVAAFVGELAAQAGLSQHKAYWLRLATEEITTNIAQHGYHGSGPVRLVGEIQPDEVRVRIEDEAPAFDPRTHDPGPRLATEPALRPEGGYGLLLALRKLDGFAYERAGDTNSNTLIMCRGTERPGADETEGACHGHVDGLARR
jgi:serine/threonine-protein kinase RsbW